MPAVRVLVVDDSVVIRRIVARMFEEESEIDVVGSAENGREALARIAELEPDLVVLDIEMPVMDGIATLRELKGREFRPRVIMFSTLTQRGAMKTIDALMHGASDYVAKPESASSVNEVKADLLDKVKALGRHAAYRATATKRSAAPTKRVPRPSVVEGPHSHRLPAAGPPPGLVVIGSSTGGPDALAAVFSAFSAPLPAPVLVCQHMPPLFTARLAERLSEAGSMKVREATSGEPLVPGVALVAPGGVHLEIRRRGQKLVTLTHDGPARHSCRPAVDVLFQSVADVAGGRTLAVVLTGMGSDGAAGSRAIAKAGGEVLAQDRETSVVWGMPGATVDTGIVRQVLPIEQIGRAIESRFARPLARFDRAKTG